MGNISENDVNLLNNYFKNKGISLFDKSFELMEKIKETTKDVATPFESQKDRNNCIYLSTSLVGAIEEMYRFVIKDSQAGVKDAFNRYCSLSATLSAAGVYSACKNNDNSTANKIIETYKLLKIDASDLELLNDAYKKGTNKSSSTCFICNAVYTDFNEYYKIEFFRTFRDTVLNHNDLGKFFVRWYYRQGQKLAKVIYSYKILKFVIKIILNLLFNILTIRK